MSANKGFETKLREDENSDSGFISCEVSGQCEPDKEECTDETPKVDEKQDSEPKKEEYEIESGLVADADCSGPITETTLTPKTSPSDIPPLDILFRPDDDGDTQLHIAVLHGCEKSVGTLIRICPGKTWLDVPNDYGNTPLHLAAMSGNALVTRMLVIAGVTLCVRDRLGETPLHKATALRNVECIKALLAPVPEKPRRLSSLLEQKNYNGQSCVHIAAALGHIETLQTLVYYGADINATENLAGWTPLHIAARRGDLRLVQYLGERCAGVALRARDFGGRSARHLARRDRALERLFERLFSRLPADSDDSDYDSDDDLYDSDSESLFESLTENMNLINVA